MAKPFRFSLTATGVNDPAQFTELCRRAEGLGYSTISMADHLDDQLAPMLALTAAAQATTTLRVLSLVLANDYRHPAILAKEITTLDQLSGGRLEFGIGAGWMVSDYEQAGLPYDRPGVRIGRLAEAVEILRAALFGGTCRPGIHPTRSSQSSPRDRGKPPAIHRPIVRPPARSLSPRRHRQKPIGHRPCRRIPAQPRHNAGRPHVRCTAFRPAARCSRPRRDNAAG